MKKLSELVSAAAALGQKRHVVAAYAQDFHTIEAASDAVDQGIARVTLIGEKAIIEQVCRQEKIDANKFEIVDILGDTACVEHAVRMVSAGQADVLMKGLVSTDKYMRGILSKEYGLLPPKGVLSHIAVMDIPSYEKLLIISDIAIIPYPDLSQKAAIIGYQRKTAAAMGISPVKVACIAPTEQMLPNIKSCSEGAILSKMAERGQLGDVIVEGPISVDVAMMADVAELKKVKGSKIAGDVDAMLFDDLDAANVFFKALTKLAGAELAGIVAGAKAPCVLTSRGDTRLSKLYSIALACICA